MKRSAASWATLFTAAALALAAACSSGGGSNAKCSTPAGTPACPNGAAVEACVTSNADGTCASTYYSVGLSTFACASCTDCAAAAASAVQACGVDGGGPFGVDASGVDGTAGPDSASPVSGLFAGTWACTGSGSPSCSPTQTCADTTVVVTLQGSVLTYAFQGDAGFGCSLQFTAIDTVGTLANSQACETTKMGTGGTLTDTDTFSGGSSSVTGNAMSIFLQYSNVLVLTPADGGTPMMLTNTGSTHLACNKL